MSLHVSYQNECNCTWLTKLFGDCYCHTTDVCDDCYLNQGTVCGYGNHSDLPFYKCQDCRNTDELKVLKYKKQRERKAIKVKKELSKLKKV